MTTKPEQKWRLVRKARAAAELRRLDAEILNATNSISRFHPHAQSPDYAATADQALWLEHRITGLLERPRDVLLDIDGGWTAFH